jgi:hypothetical protein
MKEELPSCGRSDLCCGTMTRLSSNVPARWGQWKDWLTFTRTISVKALALVLMPLVVIVVVLVVLGR